MSQNSASQPATLKGFCTLKEIAAFYDLHPITMKKKLVEKGFFILEDGKPKRKFSPNEVSAIRKAFG